MGINLGELKEITDLGMQLVYKFADRDNFYYIQPEYLNEEMNKKADNSFVCYIERIGNEVEISLSTDLTDFEKAELKIKSRKITSWNELNCVNQ